jgi:23S rRNA pseudouridine1911/1915/1917 synthase
VCPLTPELTFEVSEAEAGRRLDVVLVARVEGMSRARARRLAEAGKVQVNGQPARKGRTVSEGDAVSLLELPASPDFEAAPDPELPLDVLYEDAYLVVVNKAAGVPTHPLRLGERATVAGALVARYPEMRDVGYAAREPGVLHRLDIGTTGVLLAARDAETFEALREALRRGRIDKRYQALCAGLVTAPAVIEAPIDADPKDKKRVRVYEKGFAPSGARHARTEIVGVRRVGEMSLVEARARTGARHQVRAHLASIGHPLAGDALYGGPMVPGLGHHFLHANRIELTHPRTEEPVCVEAPLSDADRSIVEKVAVS